MFSKDYLHLHIIVIILGFTAILGRLISLDAIDLVWYRTVIAAISSFAICFLLKIKINISIKEILWLIGIGFIVGIHWILFFHSIKVSNVSICLATLPVSTLFTSFFEPLTQKRKISKLEVITGIVILLGLNTIFQFELKYAEGIIYGIASFILAGLFPVLNKNLTSTINPVFVNAVEMSSAWIGLSIFILFSETSFPAIPNNSDLFYLVVLGTICTTYAFSATVFLLKKISAYSVVLAINLEPVYGILLALPFFGESELMTPGFYLGAAITFVAVMVFPILKKKYN